MLLELTDTQQGGFVYCFSLLIRSLCSMNPLHSLISVHAGITFYISQVITAEQETVLVENIEEKRYVGEVAKESVEPFSTNIKYGFKKRSATWLKAMKLATRFVIHHHPLLLLPKRLTSFNTEDSSECSLN